MRRLFFIPIFIFSVSTIVAQVSISDEKLSEETKPEIFNRIVVDQDSRLNKLIFWHTQQNRGKETMDGYRVEIYFGSNADAKKNAEKEKLDFLSGYPYIPVYLTYDAPNFRVRVGDFRTKSEALKLYNEIKDSYTVAFIVADKIELPSLNVMRYE
ncbi:MAG: hypothetical protein CSA36_06600 [Draconibacterium sp.]|nr:MAG: hypothetical protein CSA36_06600 [Draconibacterium sp.]